MRFAERGAGPKTLLTKYKEILARLRQGPVEVTDGGDTFKIRYQGVVYTTLSLLYYAPNSPLLARFLEDLHEATEAADQRTAQGGTAPEVDVPDVPGEAPRSSGRKAVRSGSRHTSGWSGFPG